MQDLIVCHRKATISDPTCANHLRVDFKRLLGVILQLIEVLWVQSVCLLFKVSFVSHWHFYGDGSFVPFFDWIARYDENSNKLFHNQWIISKHVKWQKVSKIYYYCEIDCFLMLLCSKLNQQLLKTIQLLSEEIRGEYINAL